MLAIAAVIACCGDCLIFWGTERKGLGALSNEAPPPDPKKRAHICLLMDSRENSLKGIIPFTFISFYAVLFPCRAPYPNILVSFSFTGVPFLLSGSLAYHFCMPA